LQETVRLFLFTAYSKYLYFSIFSSFSIDTITWGY